MCNSVTSRTAGRELDRRDNEQFFKCKSKCCTSCSYCARAFSKERNKSRGSSCHYKRNRLKFVKGVSCVIPLSSVKPAINAPNVATNLPVVARLQNFWEIWLDLGAGPKVVQILKEVYALPFRIRPNLTRSPTVISCYGNPQPV